MAAIFPVVNPHDLSRLSLPSDPRLHPDGVKVVFVRTEFDIEHDRYDRSIWFIDGDTRRFTAGPGDAHPRWSPDGSRLAFLRKKEGKEQFPQVAVMPSAGGEAAVITSFDLGVEDFVWSPDGSKLAVVAVTWIDEWAGLDEEERGRKPRRITRLPFRYDNHGWLHDRRRHIWLIDPSSSKEPTCLTPGDFDEEGPTWHPDGDRVAFLSNRFEQPGLHLGNHVFEVASTGGEPVSTAEFGGWVGVGYRPDGVKHLIGDPSTDYPVVHGLWREEPDGELTSLTSHLDRATYSLLLGPPEIHWVGNQAISILEDSGHLDVIEVSVDGQVISRVEDKMVTGFTTTEQRLVYTATTPTSPGEVYEAGRDQPLTRLNGGDLGLVQPEHWTVGEHAIDAWAYLPPGDGAVPLLLNIHGGPASQYTHGFFDEFQVYVDAGFGVVCANPRGSSGRGLDFVKAVVGDRWGTVDVEDVDAVVASALERFPRLDPERMGIMGGSYGGFLTAWMICHQERWKSAVVERALTSWTSFGGTSDIGGIFADYYLLNSDWDRRWQASPLAEAHNIKTPTLIVHSEDDYRCPVEQGEQLFMALLRAGTPTEFLRFPGEGHEMSRSGKPTSRLHRYQAVVDWHRRWLMPDTG